MVMRIVDKVENKVIFDSTYVDGFIAFVNILQEEEGHLFILNTEQQCINYIQGWRDEFLLEL